MTSLIQILIVVAFFLPTIIAVRRKVVGLPAVIGLNLMVVTWPWAIALAFNPITRDFTDPRHECPKEKGAR